VLEIGPGRGALTDLLADRAGRLIAIEYDRALAELLRQRYARRGNVLIAEADVLEVSLGELAAGPYLLVGNVPYYITTPILFHALAPPRAERSVYLVQKEVADRLSAAPGSKEYGALTVNVAAVARAETLFKVPAGAFSPPPRVESAVVRITPLADPLVSPPEERSLRTFVQNAFGMRRKQMRRVLRSMLSLDAEAAETLLARTGIDPEVRPETLTPVQFVALLRASRTSS
jgi:16S rRNA (adenine1518-N6/adenine1519-N6)-dimethyltransferase